MNDEFSDRAMLYPFMKQHLARLLSTPFHNAIILKQVQFVPSEAFLHELCSEETEDSGIDESESELLESEDGSFLDTEDLEHSLDRSFQDEFINNAHSKKRETGCTDPLAKLVTANSVADASGYLMRATYSLDDPTRPPFQIAVLDHSTLGVISQIASKNEEGLASLWKG